MNNECEQEYTYLDELTQIYSELHKDVYGVKARWARFDTEAEAQESIDRLYISLRQEQEHEDHWQTVRREREQYQARMGLAEKWIPANKFEAMAGEP